MMPWPSGFSTTRASINSFGYGGANAHAIIEGAQSILPGTITHASRGQLSYDEDTHKEMIGVNSSLPASSTRRSEFLLMFSAHDSSTLKKNIEKHRDVAEDYNILDLAYTLGCRRSAFFNCAYSVVREEYVDEDLMEHEITFVKRGKGGNIAFIFTGQGAQSAQMGRELMIAFPSYLDTIRKLDCALQSLGGDAPKWTLEDVLMEPETSSRIDDVEISQPSCTAIQIAIVDLLRLWNVNPIACIGHSSGEIASAYAAGLISAEEAIISAFYRGLGVGTLTVPGKMLAVGASPEETQPYLVKGLCIACYNSPSSVTLSGNTEAAAETLEKLKADNVFVRELRTSGRAYHSHHMKLIGDNYEKRLTNALSCFTSTPSSSRKERKMPIFFSSVKAKKMPDGFKPGPSYWRENLESPVRFSEAVKAALSDELDISQFVEIGPHSALAGPLRQIRDSLGMTPKDLDYAPTLVRKLSSVTRLLDLAGNLSTKGYPIDLESVNAIEVRNGRGIVRKTGLPIVDLPRISWNYSAGAMRNENRPDEEYRLRKFQYHDLLGAHLPGCSSEQMQWRNLLDAKNFPWLEDHKLGSQSVLPATGYLAIATEAARQFFHGRLTFDGPFRYFFPTMTIKSALVVPPAGTQVEIVTTMKFSSISASVNSKKLAEFTISSVTNGLWTNHCVGTVTKKEAKLITPNLEEKNLQEPKSARTWYRGFQKVSLNYGRAFNGLSGIGTNPLLREAVANTELLPEGVSQHDSAYLVHPTAMDTCIQLALIAVHKGSLKDLKKSFVPTSMTNVSLWSWTENDHMVPLTDSKGKVFARAAPFGQRVVMGQCQIFSSDNKPLFEIGDLECTQYAEALDELGTIDRHPYLRTVWKPDLDKLNADFAVDSLLDLIVHKYPSLDICEILSEESSISDELQKTLDGGSSLHRYKTYTFHSLEDVDLQPTRLKYEAFPGVKVQKTNHEDDPERKFHLIILTQPQVDESTLSHCKVLLTEDGIILLSKSASRSEDVVESLLLSQSLQIIRQDSAFFLIGPLIDASPQVARDIILVTRNSPTQFDSNVQMGLENAGITTKLLSLQDTESDVETETTYVFIVESTRSLFHDSLTDQELANLQAISGGTHDILWVTHGDLLVGGDPNAGLVIGLGRCLTTENPTLNFRTLDLDHRDPAQTAANIKTVLTAVERFGSGMDTEFMVKNSVFHVARLARDPLLDQYFVASAETEPNVVPYNKEERLRLAIERIGIFDTIYFREDECAPPLEPIEVEVEVKAIGLNMKDYATLQGTYNSDNLGFEGAGIVRKIGSHVTNVAVGDRVNWFGFGNFRNIERVDSRFLQKLRPEESFDEMACLMIPFLTACYGLIHAAKLQRNETVLIHSGTGGVGLAAIQIAKMIGAEIFVTVGNKEKKEFLKKTYGIDDDHILSSHDVSFAPDIMRLTNGRGIDVILNSLVGERLRATWSIIGRHGRHIELGQTDILDHGTMDMSPFKRAASFIAMDLVLDAKHKPDLVSSILSDIMKYYREGKIQLLPNIDVFPVSEISSAFKEFASQSRIGRVVVSFESETIRTVIKRKPTMFNPNGAYLLVGCLGGLGRCLARHMAEKGARHFIFLGRSGEDRPEAASMIRDFRNDGIIVEVVKGSVVNMNDVQKAVKLASGPILGVIQGVMALDDRLFTRHDLESWEYAIRPKVTGTWNLHNAVAGHPLDFFVMLGSTAAFYGFSTQSNYAVGNSFLEYFARFRQAQGLPATTISLTVVSEVGFVSQNEKFEQGLLRTGVHIINEAGFIDLIDTAIANAPPPSWNYDPLATTHIVTGLEPLQLSADIDVDGSRFWRQPRAGPVINAVLAKKSGGATGAGRVKRSMLLPDIREMILEKFSQTFNVAVEDINPEAELVRFGMDSMIVTGLRTWCYKTFGVDIPTSDFMSLTLTAEWLSQNIFDARKG
ncbi:Reducing polyketide synthase boa9 [Clarireedia jacksonii]